MSAMFLAMVLTGAGGLAEARGDAKPPPPTPVLMAPMAPPVPMVVPPPPAVILPPSPPPPRVAQEPVLLRGEPICLPFGEAGSFPFDSCFNPSDFPMAAYEARQQGIVGIRLTVARDPAATRCEITASSGSAILDRATCDILRRRAFASEDNALVIGQVAWVLPDEPPVDRRSALMTYFSADDYPAASLRANEQGQVAFIAYVAPSGRVSECRLTQSSGSPWLDAATCRIVRARTRFLPARDAAGNAVPGTWSGRISWRLPSE